MSALVSMLPFLSSAFHPFIVFPSKSWIHSLVFPVEVHPAMEAAIIRTAIAYFIVHMGSLAFPRPVYGYLRHLLLKSNFIEELLKWEGCDAVINLGILGRRIFAQKMADSVARADPTASSEFLQAAVRQMVAYEEHYVQQLARLMEKYQKPILGVSLLTGAEDQTVYTVAKSTYKSVFYPSPERAVKALSKMVEYAHFLNR